jgi:hypothetical protein
MSNNSIIGSVFLFITLVCTHFYWIKDPSLKWTTLGALVPPVSLRFIVSGIEDFTHADFLIRIPLEICVSFATYFLILHSYRYLALRCRLLLVPSACKGCSYYHGMDGIVCGVHPGGPIDQTCKDYQ